MPLVMDNKNTNEIIARFVFDKNLFTVFFRKASCGVGAEGENFCNEFNNNLLLRSYNPQVIINDADSRHRHFQAQDKKLVHVHVGFDSSIEHLEAVRAILIATSEIHKNVLTDWSALETNYNAKLRAPICGSMLFSSLDNMVVGAEKFFSRNRLSIDNSLCFWSKSNGKTQTVACKNLITDIPTEADIITSVKSIIALSQSASATPEALTTEENINFEPPVIGPGVLKPNLVDLIPLLLVCIWLLKTLFRPAIPAGLRR